MFGFTRLYAGADGAVDGFRFVISSIKVLLVFGVDEGVFAVLASFDFVGHKSFLFVDLGGIVSSSRLLASLSNLSQRRRASDCSIPLNDNL